MKLINPLLIVAVVVAMSICPGCGAETDANPKDNDTGSAPALASIEDSAPRVKAAGVSINGETDTRTEPLPGSIVLAQAQSTQTRATVTIANEGEQPADPSSTSPTFGEGNLWISGQANRLDSATREKAEASFEWVTPGDAKTSGGNTAGDSGFQWVDGGPKELSGASQAALEQAEADRRAAEAKARQAINAAQRKADEEVSAARTQMEKELQALREEQARVLAEIEVARKSANESAAANAKSLEELAMLKEQTEKERTASVEAALKEATANALATAKAQDEVTRLKAEAAKQLSLANAEAEAARKEAKENAAAKAKVEVELEQARLEQARIQADADKARMRAESEAEAKAVVEAALLKSKEEQADSERAARSVELSTSESAPSAPKSSKPLGTIQLAKLQQGALREGVYGIQLGSRAEIENLSGAKIEIAAYFFDHKGNPLKDKDNINRSSRGQVYVGKESVVPSNAFSLMDDLFIPYQQLDLASKEARDLQVELVLWEYSQGRGQRLAIAPRTTFRHTPLSTPERVNLVQRRNLSGTWQQDDAVITIVQQEDRVVINGLGIVPYTIVSEKWVYADGILRGSIINKRKLPPITRVWEFNLQISEDGNTLSGTFHRSDRKGNFAFDSAPFVWTRIR